MGKKSANQRKGLLLKRCFAMLAVIAMLITQQPIVHAMELSRADQEVVLGDSTLEDRLEDLARPEDDLSEGAQPEGTLEDGAPGEDDAPPATAEEEGETQEGPDEAAGAEDQDGLEEGGLEDGALEGDTQEDDGYPEEGGPELEGEGEDDGLDNGGLPGPGAGAGLCGGYYCQCDYCDGACDACHEPLCTHWWCNDRRNCSGGNYAECVDSWCPGSGTARPGDFCSPDCCCEACDEEQDGCCYNIANICPLGDNCPRDRSCPYCFGHDCCGGGGGRVPCRCGPNCVCDDECGCNDGDCPCQVPSITKEVMPDNPIVGNDVTYMITVNNTANSTALSDVRVVDELPRGLARPETVFINGVERDLTDDEITVNTWVCPDTDETYTYYTIALDIATVPAYGAVVIMFSTEVRPDAAGRTLVNTAYLYLYGDDSPLDYAEAPATVPSLDAPSITKTASTEDVQVGDSFQYTITVQNNAHVSLNQVVVRDILPAELCFDDFDYTTDVTVFGATNYQVTFNPVTRELVITIPYLPGDSMATIFIPATVPEDAEPGVINNVANLIVDGDPADSSDVDVEILPPDDPTISKSVNVSETQVGDYLHYIITVNNPNNLTLRDLRVEDVFPAGMEPPAFIYIGATRHYVDDNGIVTTIQRTRTGTIIDPDTGEEYEYTETYYAMAIDIDEIGPLGEVMITFSVQVPRDMEGEILTNVVYLYREGEDDPVDSCEATSEVGEIREPRIEKVATPYEPLAGETVWYFITVTNPSHLPLENVRVEDTLSSQMQLIPGTQTVRIGGANAPADAWNFDPVTNLIYVLIPSIPANGSVVISFQVRLSETASGSIPNTATLILPGEDDRTADAIVTIPITPDPEITKTANINEANVGDSVIFTITVDNESHLDRLVSVRDFLPPYLSIIGTPSSPLESNITVTGSSTTPVRHPVVRHPGERVPVTEYPYGYTWQNARPGYYTDEFYISNITIPRDSHVTIQMLVRVERNGAEDRHNFPIQINRVYLYETTEVDDEPVTNEVGSDSEPVRILTPPPPTIEKSVQRAVVPVGETILYTLTVTNPAHVPAVGLHIREILPLGVPMPATVMVNGVSTPTTVIRQWYEQVNAGAVDEDGQPEPPIMQRRYEFGIGPLPSIPAGGITTITFSVTATEAIAGRDLVNTATLNRYDPVTVPPDDNHEYDRDTATVYVPEPPEPTIEKRLITAGQDAELGQLVTFVLTVRNHDMNRPIVGHRVEDRLPTGLQFVSSIPAPTYNYLESPDYYGNGTDRLIFDLADIPAGLSATVVITARVLPDLDLLGETLVNWAYLYGAPDDETNERELIDRDPEPIVIGDCEQPHIHKSVNTENPIVGQVITYTITITNPTGIELTNVWVRDDLPPGIIPIPGSFDLDRIPLVAPYITQGDGWFLVDVGTVPATGSRTITFNATVTEEAARVQQEADAGGNGNGNGDDNGYDNGYDNGNGNGYDNGDDNGQEPPAGPAPPLRNWAHLYIDPDDGDPPFSSDWADVRVPPLDPPTIYKSANVPVAMIGQTITYTLAVTNNSHLPITEAWVLDILPAELEFVGIVGGGFSYEQDATNEQRITFHIPGTEADPAFGPNETRIIRFTAVVRDTAPADGTIENTAYLYLTNPDLEGSEPVDEDDAVVTLPPIPSPQIFKTVSTPTALLGQTVFYTITVINPHNQPLTGVRVVDHMPAGLIPDLSQLRVDGEVWAYVDGTDLGSDVIREVDPDDEDALIHDPNGVVIAIYNLTIPATGSLMIAFPATIDADHPVFRNAPGDVARTNIVDLVVDGEVEDSCDATVTVPPLPDPSIRKLASPEVVLVGRDITYTLTITNRSHLARTDVEVRDRLPAGLIFESDTRDADFRLVGNATFADPAFTWEDDGEVLVFHLETLGANSAVSIIFTTEVTRDAIGERVANTAWVWDNEAEGDEAVVIVPEPPPPTLVKTVDVYEALPEDIVTYFITVTNPSHLTELDLWVVDVIDSALEVDVDSITATIEGEDIPPGDIQFESATNTLRVRLAVLEPGEVALITFEAEVLPGAVLAYPEINTIENIARLYRGDPREPEGEFIREDEAEFDVHPPSITKVVNGEDVITAVVDEVVVYTITVTNHSPTRPLTNIWVRDHLPGHIHPYLDTLAIDGQTLEAADFSFSAPMIIIPIAGPIAPGDSVEITFDARVLEAALTAGQPLDNVAYLYVEDPATGDSIDDDNAIINLVPDPTIEKWVNGVDAIVAMVGEVVTYTIRVSNTYGAYPLSNVWVRDHLPEHIHVYTNTIYIGATRVEEGGPNGFVFRPADRMLIIPLPEIPAGGFLEITFDARVLESALDVEGPLDNVAYLYIGNPDAPDNEAIEDDNAIIEVIPVPTIRKQVNGQNSITASANQRVTYTIRVSNAQGAHPTPALWVRDPIPAHLREYVDTLRLDGQEPEAGSFTFTEGVLTIMIPSIPAGGHVDITFEAVVLASAAGNTIDNIAYLFVEDPADLENDDAIAEDNAVITVPQGPGNNNNVDTDPGPGPWQPPPGGEPDDDDPADDEPGDYPGDHPGDEPGDGPGEGDNNDPGGDPGDNDPGDTPGDGPGGTPGDGPSIPQTGDEFGLGGLLLSGLGFGLALLALFALLAQKKGTREG